jgi:hypothetical protein
MRMGVDKARHYGLAGDIDHRRVARFNRVPRYGDDAIVSYKNAKRRLQLGAAVENNVSVV